MKNLFTYYIQELEAISLKMMIIHKTYIVTEHVPCSPDSNNVSKFSKNFI